MPRGFDHFIGATVDFTAIGENPIVVGDWRPLPEVSLEALDWETFFHGSGLSHLLTDNWRPPPESLRQPILGVLVETISAVFAASRQLQTAPNLAAAAKQLAEMRGAAERLADLARVGDGEGWSGEPPAWLELRANHVEGPDFVGASGNFDYPSAAIHPQLQRLIADAAYLRELKPGERDSVSAEDTHIDTLRLTRAFFERLGGMIASLNAASLLAESSAASLDSAPKRGAPPDNARNWALIRLIWIFRDAIGGKPTIYLRKLTSRDELETPEPNECMRFVIDAMAHVEPIMPHQQRALERKLSELILEVPVSPLFQANSRGNSPAA